jgi:hypothetical protein
MLAYVLKWNILLTTLVLAQHTTYSWHIKWQKCAGMGLNGFIFKKINENKKKILGAF